MHVALTALAIRPGGTPAVTAAAWSSLRSAAVDGFVTLLATEIGEVNALVAVHRIDDFGPTLSRLDAWLRLLRASEAGAQLRHVDVTLFRREADALPPAALASASMAGALMRTVRAAAASTAAAGADSARDLVLHPVTGDPGTVVLLTPITSLDASLALGVAALDATAPGLLGSRLLVPVRRPPESA